MIDLDHQGSDRTASNRDAHGCRFGRRAALISAAGIAGASLVTDPADAAGEARDPGRSQLNRADRVFLRRGL